MPKFYHSSVSSRVKFNQGGKADQLHSSRRGRVQEGGVPPPAHSAEAKIEMNLFLSQLAHLNKLENVTIITVGLKKVVVLRFIWP